MPTKGDSPADTPQQGERRPYEPPQVIRVTLEAEQVLGGCKLPTGAGGWQGASVCMTGVCASATSSS